MWSWTYQYPDYGNFSFEAKQRQAARVLATDHHCWTQDVKGRDTFQLAKAALNLEIDELDIDVPELTPDRRIHELFVKMVKGTS